MPATYTIYDADEATPSIITENSLLDPMAFLRTQPNGTHIIHDSFGPIMFKRERALFNTAKQLQISVEGRPDVHVPFTQAARMRVLEHAFGTLDARKIIEFCGNGIWSITVEGFSAAAAL